MFFGSPHFYKHSDAECECTAKADTVTVVTKPTGSGYRYRDRSDSDDSEESQLLYMAVPSPRGEEDSVQDKGGSVAASEDIEDGRQEATPSADIECIKEATPLPKWQNSKAKARLISELSDSVSDIHLYLGEAGKDYGKGNWRKVNFDKIKEKFVDSRWDSGNYRESLKRLLLHYIEKTGPFMSTMEVIALSLRYVSHSLCLPTCSHLIIDSSDDDDDDVEVDTDTVADASSSHDDTPSIEFDDQAEAGATAFDAAVESTGQTENAVVAPSINTTATITTNEPTRQADAAAKANSTKAETNAAYNGNEETRPLNTEAGVTVEAHSLQAQVHLSEQSTSAPFSLGLGTGTSNGGIETVATNVMSFAKKVVNSLTPRDGEREHFGKS